MRLPEKMKPVTPGEILSEEFLKPMNLTQEKFANHIGWTKTKVNQIVRGKRAVTPASALVLADALGTTPEFWLNAQRACALWEAKAAHVKVSKIKMKLAS